MSFVRRSGRMSEAQERAFAVHSAVLHARHAALRRRRPPCTPTRASIIAATYGREAPLIVEIGSGQGHAIIHAATSRPGDDFLAVDVFRAGLARTMLDAERAGVRNLRLIEANAPEVLETLLPDGAADEVWVFFPDPWHKNKHTKRRLVKPPFGEIVAGALRDGGSRAARHRLGGLRPADAGRAGCRARRSSGRSRATGRRASTAGSAPRSSARAPPRGVTSAI